MSSVQTPRLVIVVSGPSGAGKSSLCDAFVSTETGCSLIVTSTTRPPRPGEVHGQHYNFVSMEEFNRGITAGEFLEYATVHDNKYGSPRKEVERTLTEGKDVILEIDVQGGLAVRKAMPDALLVFVIPSDLTVLRTRLTNRRTDSIEVIEKRLANAQLELARMEHYDYVIFNDHRIEDAVSLLGKIIESERHCIRRYDTRRLFNPELLNRTQEGARTAKA